MKKNNKLNKEIYSTIREFYNKPIDEGNGPEEQLIDYVLGEGLNEANGAEMLTRFMDVLNSGKKKLITAAVMATLMASPAFSAAVEKAPDNVKSQITQMMGNDETNGGSEASGNYKSKDSLFTINFGGNFKSGSYDINSDEAHTKLNELGKYLTTHQKTKFKIRIIASESQVPNQAGFKQGELAKMRVQVMNKLVGNFITKNKLGQADIQMDTRVGDVPWDGKDKGDEKYTKDQFVTVEVLASGISPCELDFSENGSVASAEKDYMSYQETLEGGGSVTMTTGTIPDRMMVVKDGKVIADTGYFADAVHQYKEWKYVPMYVANLSEVLKNNPQSPAIQGIQEIKHFDDFNQLIKFMLKGESYNIKADNRQEISTGVAKLQSLWASGQRDFVFYTMKKGTINFALADGETAELRVFSPIGKTGFNLKGNCE